MSLSYSQGADDVATDDVPVYKPTLAQLQHFEIYLNEITKTELKNNAAAIRIIPPGEWNYRLNNHELEFNVMDFSIDADSKMSNVFQINNSINGVKKINTIDIVKNDDSNSEVENFWDWIKTNNSIKSCGTNNSNNSSFLKNNDTILKQFNNGSTANIEIVLGSLNSFKSYTDLNENFLINYIHKGNSKRWYVIDNSEQGKILNLLNGQNDFNKLILTPDLLKLEQIKFIEFTQNENEFIVILPNFLTYQFDLGLNLSETNIILSKNSNLKMEQDIKAKNFGELLDHSSNELSQLEEGKLANSPLSISNFNLIQGTSMRSTTPNPSQFFNNNGNQTTISRISSPLLSRMMDLSNIVEPTLEDPSLKFKKKILLNSQLSNSALSNNNNNTGISTPLNSTSIVNTGSINNTSSATNINNNPTLSLIRDNDENMLALSLASMANSRASSPRLTLPPINSAMDPNSLPMTMNNNGFLTNDNTPTMSTTSLANNGTSSILSPKPSYNTNPLSYQHNSVTIVKGMPGVPSSPTTATLPFIKRLKSPNIVTLNISREGSRSPVSYAGDYRSPLGVSNPLTYSSTGASTLSQLHQMDFNSTLNNNNINSVISNVSPPESPVQKKPKLENKSLTSASNTKRKLTVSESSVPQQSKFASNEIIMSENGKVYICQECKRQFSSGHHLTRHKKSVHSGEKPHSCPKCGKRFKRRDHVLQHLNKKIPCTQESSTTAQPATSNEPMTTILTASSNVPLSNNSALSVIQESDDSTTLPHNTAIK